MILWVGKEKEGYLHGMKTLFIGSPKITFKQIEDAIRKEHGIYQLYFGAGCCTPINQRVVKKCLKKYKGLIITMEIDITQLHKYEVVLLRRCNILITINTVDLKCVRGLNRDTTQIKLQTLTTKSKDILTCTLKKYSTVNTSLLKEKTYKGDRVLL